MHPSFQGLIPFAIKNLLNGERGFGGGQPCGLAAASAGGRRPPSAGGGPTKYHRLTFRNSLQRTGIRPRPAQPNRQTEHPLRYQGYLSQLRRAYTLSPPSGFSPELESEPFPTHPAGHTEHSAQ
jgi:hypothetical protein